MLVIEKLIDNGRVSDIVKTDRVYDYGKQSILIQTVCTACPFYRNDCDFAEMHRSQCLNRQETTNPLPCGGFIILTDLVVRNVITIDDIWDII